MAANRNQKSRLEALEIPAMLNIKANGMDVFNKLSKEYETAKKELADLEKLAGAGVKWAKDKVNQQIEYVKSLEKEYQIEEGIAALKNSEKYSFSKQRLMTGFTSGSRYERSFQERKEKNIAESFGEVLGKVFDKFIDSIKNVFSNAWEEFQDIVKNSFLTSSSTRENVLGYGMSLAQSYAFNKVKGYMGISSMEDLAYMTEGQRSVFAKAMENYSDRYTKLYDSGFFEKQLEYDMQIQELKDDLQYNLIEFLVDNKDTIMQMMDWVIKAAQWVMNVFSSGKQSAADIVNSYSNNKNINVDMSYNLTGQVAKNDVISAGQQTVKQLVLAIQNS